MPFLPALAVLALLPGLTLAQGPELTKEAIANVYKTRDKAAMGKLLAILLEPQPYRPRDKTAERILLTLGDKDGDLYDLTRKTLLGIKPNASIEEWQQIRVARILARCDSKRAYRDFTKFLDESPSRGLKKAIIHALPYLESEDGLKLLFDHLEGQDAEPALDALIDLMYPERYSKRGASIPWAKMQDLAVERLKKVLKEKRLLGEARQRALWNENFIGLVDEGSFNGVLQRFVGIDQGGQPRHKTLPAQMMDYAGQEIGFGIDMALRNDIVVGRKKLAEALALKGTLKAGEKAHLDWLQTLYGDPTAPKPKDRDERPPILVRNAKTSFQSQWQPRADFLKTLDEEPLPMDLSQGPSLEPLYPHHLDEFLKRNAAYARSDNPRERDYGIYSLETRFAWRFDLDIEDPQPARERRVAELKPLLERMGKGTLVEARAALLREFGVKLEGAPGKAWQPALEKAVCSWNPTISFNASRVLCMLMADPDLMRHASIVLHKREKELKSHLDSGYIYQALDLGKERKPLPDALAKRYRDDLNGEPEPAIRAMQELVKYPQSTLAFLRKELRVPPEPDAKRCAVLIGELGSATFKVRNQATEELKKLGEGVVPHLRRAAEKPPSVEVRRRLDELLDHFDQQRAGRARALQVLEILPGPNARYFLEELAAGPKDATLTLEAKGSLRRLQHYWQW
jgi:hypothetical protein